ncbi:MAG TPA: O-antigen ligase family protein [Solirubrobacteraceae bacterium]|nr:O-antigen ligase family protein [Solirubrobacteraceae bacterium]
MASRSWFTLAIAAVIVLICFVATGGIVSSAGAYVRSSGLAANTIVEMALTLVGGALVVAACAVIPAGRVRIAGIAVAIAMFALAALTALSVSWSVAPSSSWLEANRTLAYAAAFAGAIALVRLCGSRWRSLLGGVLLATAFVCAYALLSKVIPESLDRTDAYARLSVPFSYWNAVGLTAALGIPPALWLGARREGHGALNALAAPALCLLLVTLVLSYSRGAVLAAVIGGGLWLAFVPLRLRALALGAIAALAAGAVVVWTLKQPALADDHVALAARSAAGHHLGLLLLAAVVVSYAAALILRFAAERNPLSAARRRTLSIAVAVALALVPIAGIAALAHSSRGFFGEISHGWHDLTTPNGSQPTNAASRLTSGGSMQALYWDYALKVFNTNPGLGAGAGAYPVADQRFMTSHALADYAHGYVFQTLSDLGIVGLLVSLAVAVMWCLSAARAAGPWRARAPGGEGAERLGLLTLMAVVVVFTVHSAVDWTWFVPGDALVALLCAGWVAGRGSPRERSSSVRLSFRRLGRSPCAAAAVAAAIAVALVVAWSQWQPLRSEQAASAGETAIANAQIATASGNLKSAARQVAIAIADEKNAASYDGLDLTPPTDLADAYAQAGRLGAGQRILVHAIDLQPSNSASWLALWEYDYHTGFDLPAGRRALRAEFYLNPRNQANKALDREYIETLN